MNKITLISESTEYFDSIDKCTYPAKKVVVELDVENLVWTDALREFLAFLNSSGYISIRSSIKKLPTLPLKSTEKVKVNNE